MTADAKALADRERCALRLLGIGNRLVGRGCRPYEFHDYDLQRLAMSLTRGLHSVADAAHIAVDNCVVAKSIDVNFGHSKGFYERFVSHDSYPDNVEGSCWHPSGNSPYTTVTGLTQEFHNSPKIRFRAARQPSRVNDIGHIEVRS